MDIFHGSARQSLAAGRLAVFGCCRLEQFYRPLASKDILLSFAVKPGLVTISFRHYFPPEIPCCERRGAVLAASTLAVNQT